MTSSAEAWRAFCGELSSAAHVLDASHAPQDDLAQAAGLRYLLNLLNSGLELVVFGADPQRPEVSRPQDPSRRWGLDCPDALYGKVALDGRCTYRISAGPGTPHYIGFNVTAGALGTSTMRSVANASSPGALERRPDGSFEIVLGPTVDESSPNHLRLTEDAESCGVRQFFADWDTEQPCHIRVDRLDAPPPPRTDAPDVTQRELQQLAQFVTRSATTWDSFVTGLRTSSRNTIQSVNVNASSYGGTPDNCYGSGYVSLEPGQVAIVEMTPPPCHYWNIQIGDHWFESLDYTYRQTALNHHQTVLDADGVARFVIAADDPGYANWLDTGGHAELPLCYRFQIPRVDASALPTPALRVLGRDALDEAMPASATRISPMERARLLERRRRAVLDRFGR